MTDIKSLTARQLHNEIQRRDAEWSRKLDATIKAGMGDFRHADLVEMAGRSSLVPRATLAREYLAARESWREAHDELDRHREYHGGDKPIRPVA